MTDVTNPTRRPIGRPRGDRDIPELLLSAALRLFAERGFSATSVQAIVDAAEVTKGAMYHYFPSKDDLLYEIYGRLLRRQMARLQEFASLDEPIEDRVAKAAADVIVTSLEEFDGTVVFFQSLHELHPDKQALVRTERRAYHHKFCALIDEGQKTGTFSDVVSPDLVVDYFFGAVHHLGTWYHAGGALSPEEVADRFAHLLMASLRPSA